MTVWLRSCAEMYRSLEMPCFYPHLKLMGDVRFYLYVVTKGHKALWGG